MYEYLHHTYIDLVKTSNDIGYGEGYDQEAPTVQEIHTTPGLINSTASVTVNSGIADYEIFDGWNRLPTNIDPDGSSDYFNIVAKWKTGRVVINAETFSDIANLPEEKLLIASALTSAQRQTYGIVTTQNITYEMGHDVTTDNSIQITNSILRFDRTDMPRKINSIAPFATNDGWTLAIDYQFMPDVNYNVPSSNFYPNAAVLAGCYDVIPGENNTSSIVGFALYENRNSQYGAIGPCVGFGDMFNNASQVVSLGSTATVGKRNIVVLRKPNNSNALFIYSGRDGELSLASTVYMQQKNWNKVTSDAKLELGQLSHSSLSALVANAKGTIYWAKYWPEDLGIGACKQLAAWPHEKITFAIAKSNTNPTPANRLSPADVALTLTALSGTDHGTLVQGVAGKNLGDVTGWATSQANTLCNTRVFNGLPTRLQSIIAKPSVATKNLVISSDGGGSNISVLSNIVPTRDYIYLPSAANYISSVDYQQEDGLFPWANSGKVTVYNYNTDGSQFSNGTANASYKNLRFAGKPISLSSLRVLVITGQVSNIRNLINGENSLMGTVQEGDIVIDNGYAAYMYVSSASIIANGLQVEPSTGKFDTEGSGGWLRAQPYWTRSMGYGNTNNYFIYIDDENGALQYTGSGNSDLSLNYSFSV